MHGDLEGGRTDVGYGGPQSLWISLLAFKHTIYDTIYDVPLNFSCVLLTPGVIVALPHLTCSKVSGLCCTPTSHWIVRIPRQNPWLQTMFQIWMLGGCIGGYRFFLLSRRRFYCPNSYLASRMLHTWIFEMARLGFQADSAQSTKGMMWNLKQLFEDMLLICAMFLGRWGWRFSALETFQGWTYFYQQTKINTNISTLWNHNGDFIHALMDWMSRSLFRHPVTASKRVGSFMFSPGAVFKRTLDSISRASMCQIETGVRREQAMMFCGAISGIQEQACWRKCACIWREALCLWRSEWIVQVQNWNLSIFPLPVVERQGYLNREVAWKRLCVKDKWTSKTKILLTFFLAYLYHNDFLVGWLTSNSKGRLEERTRDMKETRDNQNSTLNFGFHHHLFVACLSLSIYGCQLLMACLLLPVYRCLFLVICLLLLMVDILLFWYDCLSVVAPLLLLPCGSSVGVVVLFVDIAAVLLSLLSQSRFVAAIVVNATCYFARPVASPPLFCLSSFLVRSCGNPQLERVARKSGKACCCWTDPASIHVKSEPERTTCF